MNGCRFAIRACSCVISLESRESKPANCGIKQDNGKNVFVYAMGGDNYENNVPIDGDVIWSDHLANDYAKKFADLPAAKAAQGL